MSYKLLTTILLSAAALTATAQDVKWVDDAQTIPVTSTNYINNRAPLRTQPFMKLPPTAIQPRGWVKKYLELQRDGLSGQLGEVSAWLEKKNNAWFVEGAHNGWEEAPYWLRGYSNLSYILQDKKMLAETDTWIKAIMKSVKPDGYFGPVNERDGRRELWANMLALQILQDYYDYSGDKKVLDVMKGYFQWELNYPEDKFLKDYWENSRGGDNLLSVIWLYNRAPEPWMLDLIHKIHRCTANWCQSTNLPNWHNVNIAECFREPAEYYLLTGDPKHLFATYNDQQLIRRAFGQVPGGMFGADENARMGYFDPRQGTETCGFVEQMLSDEILMAQTGDVLWADNLEDVTFNSYPASLMPDMRALRYITSPNMVQSDSENHRPGIDNGGPFLSMNPFSSRCCQHNHAMGWPYYAQNLVLASADGGAALMTYSDMSAQMKVADGQLLTIDEETHYPFDEDITLTLSLKKPTTFPIYLRIPHWAKNAAVSVNGKTTNLKKAGKLLCLTQEWKQGDRIQLHLPMELSLRTWQVNQNSVSVDYGPLTMSLLIQERYVQKSSRETAIGDSKWQEGADEHKWPTTEIYADSPWNYGIVPNVNKMKVEWGEWPADNFPWIQSKAPIRVKAIGRRIPSWTIDETGLCGVLPHASAPREKAESITLVPMGSARLRISAFPRAGK